MEINNLEQMMSFLNGILLGCCLGAIFDIFRIVRITVNCNKFFILLQDIVFSLIIGFVSMVYIVFNGDGYIRFYIILSEVIGFVIYNYTISKIIIGIYKFILSKVRKVFKVISVKLIRPIVLVLVAVFRQITKATGKVDRQFRKIKKISKFNLKCKRFMLYNLINKNSIGAIWKKTKKPKRGNTIKKRKDIT